MSAVSDEERWQRGVHAEEVGRRRMAHREEARQWSAAALDPREDGPPPADAAVVLNAATAMVRVASDEMQIGDDPRQLVNVDGALNSLLLWVDSVVERYARALDQVAESRALCDLANPEPVQRGIDVAAGLAERYRTVLSVRHRAVEELGPAAVSSADLMSLQATAGGGALCNECDRPLARHDLDMGCSWVWPRRWDARPVPPGAPDLPGSVEMQYRPVAGQL